MEKEIKVFAPATVANVGPAFDIMGFAISGIGDVVTLRFCEGEKIKIKKITGDGGVLPLDEKNTAFFAVKETMEILHLKNIGIEIEIEKNLPIGSGLGSSASSAVAAAFATNLIFGKKLEKKDLLLLLGNAEKLVCGKAHFDNVAPSLLGGFSVILDDNKDNINIKTIKNKLNPKIVICSPKIKINTKDARSVLPKTIPLYESVNITRKILRIIDSVEKGDLKMFGKTINQNDFLESKRGNLIPNFFKVKQNALDAGAIGATISGSGPSIFAVAENEKIAKKIAKKMSQTFEVGEIKSKVIISDVDFLGAREV